ncbi:unnamed protein product [Orchesella dallaii]|uniref:G-protein coupled receptors family 1 profile domain-containing protein n=1 Tax=Orchesella dallaii TaxID=48710 RepID=A0ABP1RWB8_9HEXA
MNIPLIFRLIIVLSNCIAVSLSTTLDIQQSDKFNRYLEAVHHIEISWAKVNNISDDNKAITSGWSFDFKDSSRFWVQYIFLPILVLIGMIGNGLTINILTRKVMRSSTNVYLTALAISDLLYLLFSFSMSWRHFQIFRTISFYWRYSPFGLWLTDACSSTSVWLTVSFTIERYIAICHPLKRRIYCTEKRAFFISISVCVACFALTATTPFEWIPAVNTEHLEKFNETSYFLESTEFGKSEMYRLLYHWFTTIFFVVLPLITLGILNVFLITAVRTSTIERMRMANETTATVPTFQIKNSTDTRKFALRLYIRTDAILKKLQSFQASRNDNKVTMTLISVVVLFLICQMPTALVLIYTSIHVPELDSMEENILLGLGNIFNLLVAINAASNFILYTALSDRYRNRFFGIFYCRWAE